MIINSSVINIDMCDFKDLAGWWLGSKERNLMTGNLMSHQVNRYQYEENLSILMQSEKKIPTDI